MITDAEKEGIFELKDRGYSHSRIARELGIDKKTVLKYLDEGRGESHHTESREGRHTFTPKKRVIPAVDRPSEGLRRERETAEISGLRVEQAKSMKELKEIKDLQISPELQKKKDDLEIKKINLEEFETDRKLKALTDEERRREQERGRIEEEQKRAEAHRGWILEWENWGLSQGIPRSVSLPAEWKFKVKDTVGEVLKNRLEDEPKWDIEQLVKNTINATIQPYLDEQRAKRKTQLIQLQVLPRIETYIMGEGLGAYLDAETKVKAQYYVRDHFQKSLTGDELIILPRQVIDLLNNFFRPIREKIREAQEEQARQAREKKEADDKIFWDKLKEKRKKEEIEDLLQVGMNRLNYYLLANRKELGKIDAKEQERARRYLERKLKEEIKGTEMDEEIEKIADEILDDFFFEEG